MQVSKLNFSKDASNVHRTVSLLLESLIRDLVVNEK